MHKKIILIILLATSIGLQAECDINLKALRLTIPQDTSTLAALDSYWQEVSRTVQEGDYDGYKALYHEDAVVIFAIGENKSSQSISKALSGWKKGFQETKAGKVKSSVTFRFSQRINDEDTAHETGIFSYASSSDGVTAEPLYIHFEMLLVKRNGKWLGVMEYQKGRASKAEWDALK